MFFDRGTFWVLPLTYLPQSARAHLFPQFVKIHYFCSGPVSVEPICPQPIEVEDAGLVIVQGGLSYFQVINHILSDLNNFEPA